MIRCWPKRSAMVTTNQLHLQPTLQMQLPGHGKIWTSALNGHIPPEAQGLSQKVMAEIAFAGRKEIRMHLDHMSGFRPLKSGRSLFGLGYKCPEYTPLFVASWYSGMGSPRRSARCFMS